MIMFKQFAASSADYTYAFVMCAAGCLWHRTIPGVLPGMVMFAYIYFSFQCVRFCFRMSGASLPRTNHFSYRCLFNGRYLTWLFAQSFIVAAAVNVTFPPLVFSPWPSFQTRVMGVSACFMLILLLSPYYWPARIRRQMPWARRWHKHYKKNPAFRILKVPARN